MKWKKTAEEPLYAPCGQVLEIPVGDVLPNPDQPRREFSYAELLELAQSIGENGLLNPISVAFVQGKPVLVAGERRLRAAKMLGMRTVPCLPVTADDRDRAVLGLLENLQRQDMNCFETAEGIRRLIGVYGLTQEAAAARLGCSQSAVANRLRLLRLSEEEREIILQNGLTERHARALLRVEDPARRRAILERAAKGRLTVAQTEALAAAERESKPSSPRAKPVVRDLRVFANTVDHAAAVMRRSGLEVRVDRAETEEYIQFTVRVEKPGRR